MVLAKKTDSPASLTPVRDAELRNAIFKAIENYDIAASKAWDELDALSTNTEIDSIEANTEGIFDAGNNQFEATGTIYVILNYGDRKDAFSTTDAFPIHVTGKIKTTGKIEIEKLVVDTSSFFDEGEDFGADDVIHTEN